MALDPTTTPHIPASATKPSVLFWDYQNTLAPPDVNTVKFGYEIMELASSLKPFKIQLARVYHSNNLTPKQITEFSKLGYELCIQDPSSKCPDYFMDMILWFLDNRISIGSCVHPASVIIVTSNCATLQPLVSRLRQRSIHVVLVSAQPYDPSFVMDVDLMYNIEDLFQAARHSSYFVTNEKPFLYLSTSDDVMMNVPPSMGSRSPGAVYRLNDSPHTYASSNYTPTPRPADSFDFGDPYDEFKSPRYRMDMSTLNQEESALYAEIYSAIQSRNTRVTIAVLRKIYTKQTRGFRIPDLLREVFPQIGENGILTSPLASAYILFTLSCVQWCLGMPTGEKPDSYKYKMNKNIARWLFKELQRKGVPAVLPQDLAHAVQSVVTHIFELNIEADFAQELAATFCVAGPVPKFQAPSPKSPHLYESKFTFDNNPHAVPLNTPRDRDTFSQIADLLSTGMSIQQIHNAIPRMSVDHRLFLLVAKSPGGLLGARIPSLYREVFNDRLRLQGRKLKDILLVSGKVDMVGSDGPGDKLFRLIYDPFNPRASEQLDHSGLVDYSGMGLPGQFESSNPNELLWNTDASLFGRFHNFPRDEGSQLDKLIASLSLSTAAEGPDNDAQDDADDLAEGEVSPTDSNSQEIDYLRFQSFGMGQL